MQNLNKHTNTHCMMNKAYQKLKLNLKPTVNCKNCSRVRVLLCRPTAYSTEWFWYFSSCYPPANHHR